jgi:hypothetical protein
MGAFQRVFCSHLELHQLAMQALDSQSNDEVDAALYALDQTIGYRNTSRILLSELADVLYTKLESMSGTSFRYQGHALSDD